MAVAIPVLSPMSVNSRDQHVGYYTQGGWLEGFISHLHQQPDDDCACRLLAAVEAFTCHL